MLMLRQFEIDAITLLSHGALNAVQLAEVMNSGTVESYEYTGCGYYLTISHSSLPHERRALSSPTILGTSGSVRCGFVGFLGDGKFVLECHTWGEENVPANIRNMEITVSVEDVG